MSNEFIKHLREFNRKERYYVVAAATDKGFSLSKEFKEEVNKKLPDGIEIGDSGDAFVAMDFHLDWIYASLFLTGKNQSKEQVFNMPEEDGLINGSQEDVDLLIAFPDKVNPEKKSHLILIEAKFDTPWSESQAASKKKRLESIFGENNEKWSDIVTHHFFICSPIRPVRPASKVENEGADKNQSEIPWFKLEIREPLTLKKIVRGEKIGNKYSKWKVVNVPLLNDMKGNKDKTNE